MDTKDETNDEDALKPTFRIRFTIGSSSSKTSEQVQHNVNKCDHERCKINETYYCNNHQIDSKSKEKLCETSSSRKTTTSDKKSNRFKKLFKFIEPQNHKSALFVNLNDNSSSANSNSGSEREHKESHLFISPNLDHIQNSETPPTTPPITATTDTPTTDHSQTGSSSIQPESNSSLLDRTIDSTISNDSTMSHRCNFINSWCTARKRASSATPSAAANNKQSNVAGQSQRASSSDDLVEQQAPPLASRKSSSGNHLTVGAPNESVGELTQTNNRDIGTIRTPLRIDIDERGNNYIRDFERRSPMVNQPIGLDEILQIDFDNLALEDECKKLESQVELWEEKVEELERKRFREDVPRTLIDSIVEKRKELRDLEVQMYKYDMDESDRQSGGDLSQTSNFLFSPSEQYLPNKFNDSQLYIMHDYNNDRLNNIHVRESKFTANKFGSQIKPGQENTADILDAIPPPGAFQQRQYLRRSSTGTDTSEYSQLPLFSNNFHRHNLSPNGHQQQQQQQQMMFTDDSSVTSSENLEAITTKQFISPNQAYQDHRSRHHHQQQQQQQQSRVAQQEHRVYVQLDSVNERPNVNRDAGNKSPIRPNHFKTDLRSPLGIVSQDSFSSASSSSDH